MSKKKVVTPAPKTEQPKSAPKTEQPKPELKTDREREEERIAAEVRKHKQTETAAKLHQGRALLEFWEGPHCQKSRKKFKAFCDLYLQGNEKTWYNRMAYYKMLRDAIGETGIDALEPKTLQYISDVTMRKIFRELTQGQIFDTLDKANKALKNAENGGHEAIVAAFRQWEKRIQDKLIKAPPKGSNPKGRANSKAQLDPTQDTSTHGTTSPGRSAPTLEGLQAVLKHTRESIVAYLSECENSDLGVYWPVEDNDYMASLLGELKKEIDTLSMRARLRKAS